MKTDQHVAKFEDLNKENPVETEGQWMDFANGIELLIAPMGNRKYDERLQDLYRERSVAKKTSATLHLSRKVVREMTQIAASEHVVLGWRGIDIEYSPIKCLELFKNNYRFYKEVIAMSGGIAADMENYLAVLEGNSGSGSHTN